MEVLVSHIDECLDDAWMEGFGGCTIVGQLNRTSI